MKLFCNIIGVLAIITSVNVAADEQGDREREILRENTTSETYNNDQKKLEEREREREDSNKGKDK